MTEGTENADNSLNAIIAAAAVQAKAEQAERAEAEEHEKVRQSFLTLQSFLETSPSGVKLPIKDLWSRERRGSGSALLDVLAAPQITLNCEVCEGDRVFKLRYANPQIQPGNSDLFLTYFCRNCGTFEKRYSVHLERGTKHRDGYATKYGEVPPLGQRLPRRLEKVAGDGLHYLRKGYKAELAGMGIAAFAYYRRLLDTQRLRILDEIIAASKLLQADANVLAELEAAKKETRFTTSVDAVKHGLPQGLLIDGHNPLTLLHDALSDGLHSESDEDCLQLATTIRVLLTEILERIAVILTEKKELKSAVANLLKRKAQKAGK